MTAPGLRERKKQKTRWSIQEQALRLFAEQGYEATTVEQIAAAAEISPSTFFRYFRSKEDVVVEDDYDPMIAARFVALEPGLPPVAALRRAIREAFAQLAPAELARIAERTTLQMSVPVLRARTFENLISSQASIGAALADRLGRSPEEFPVRAFAGAAVGVIITAILVWYEAGASEPLADLIDRSLAALETGFADLA